MRARIAAGFVLVALFAVALPQAVRGVEPTPTGPDAGTEGGEIPAPPASAVELCLESGKPPEEVSKCLSRTADDTAGALALTVSKVSATMRYFDLAEEPKPDGEGKFREAQRHYEAYRDANCAFWSVAAPSSLQPGDLERACKIDMDQARRAEIETLVVDRRQ